MAQDAVQSIVLRNAYYKDSYRKVLMALVLLLVIIAGLGFILFYVIENQPKPKYFATTVDGRLIKLQPLNQPNLSPSALLQWANQAAIASYTYNFVNYRQELQTASEFFTPNGWTSFMSALTDSNNLEAVQTKKLVVSAVATGAPVVLQQGVLSGIYSWRVQMPLLVTYQSSAQYSQQSVVVTMLIQRVSPLNSARGIGISQFVASGGSTING